jgi:hypothetical protein
MSKLYSYGSQFDQLAESNKLYVEIGYHNDDGGDLWVHHIIKWRGETIMDISQSRPLSDDDLYRVVSKWIRQKKINDLGI